MKVNYNDLMLETVKSVGQSKPTLLLHACCAPCASACLERLAPYFRITVYFYNPNISTAEEYALRAEELKRLISLIPSETPINCIVEAYDHAEFLKAAVGLESEPERGSRCTACYALRLGKAREKADETSCDYFATTLTLSPLKDAERLNAIGEKLQKKSRYLPSDFKKDNGYKRSIELSKIYRLYRQNFCGCEFSKKSD